MTLSPTMEACRQFMLKHDNKIVRHPGGFWSHPAWDRNAGGEHYGTVSVHALVRRGIAEYSEWKHNSSGGFPIEAVLVEGEQA